MSNSRIGPTTQYDGQLYNNNNFLRFGGNAGLYYDLPNYSDLSEYSMSIWVRVSTTPIDMSRPLSIVTLKPGLQCFFNIRFRVQCNSDSSSSNLQIEGAVRMNNWYVLTLRSRSSQTLIQMRELSNTVFSYSNSGSFFPFGSNKLDFKQVFIGIDQDRRSDGFVGNIRNLKIFSVYYDDNSLWRSQFTYLYSFANLRFQVILQSSNDLTDDLSGTTGSIVGQTSQLTNVADYTPCFYCFLATSTDSQSGTIDQALQFDGVSCKDNKEKLYMTNDRSYIESTFTAKNDLKGYTVEFWVRPTVTLSGTNFMLAIQEPRTGTIYMVITQLSTNQLYCYTQYSQNQTARVKFLDFISELKAWQHIGCIVDTEKGFVEGVYFNSQYDFVYYEEINSNAFLAKQDFKIVLNSDPRSYRNGIQQAHYAELRIWNYSRSTQDIKNYQYHQLNVDRFRPNLLNYWKLMGAGAVPTPGEIDYADASLTKQITLTNTQWIARSDITICPFGLFKGSSSDLNCYREGISKFLIFIVKNTTHYTLTPFYTIFRNNMIRDDNRQLFNFSWTLTQFNANNQTNQNLFPSYYNFQKARKELIFSVDQVSNMPGRYSFDVQMQDMNQQMEVQKSSITLATYKCLSIFDKSSKQSVYLFDMDSKRLSEDHYFYYDYTQCGNYVFDQSSMTIDIDYSDKILLLNTDHDKTKKSFKLRAGVQQYLPLNEYFYIRMKGVWRNSQDKSDIIEYYLIYGCRYISKLVPKLKPNYFLVLRGQELVMNYEAAYYNMPDNIIDRTWTTKWICPEQLDVYCKNQGQQLRLPYSLFLNSGLPFWQALTIKIVLQTNFIQGDGTKESVGSIDIVWSDVNPDAQALMASPIINKEYRIAYQVNIVNMPEAELSIDWTSNPAIPTNCWLNSNNRKQFVVNPTCISEGVDYNVTCSIYYLQQSQVIWQSWNIFRIPISPRGGSISCDRTSGKAYLDQFSCNTGGWTLQTISARYQFYVTEVSTGNLIPLSGLINQVTFVSTLPPTNKITVKVVDTNGGIAYATLAVSVTYSYESALVTKVQTLVNTAYASRTNTNLQSIVAITQASAIINNIGNTTIQSTTGRDILDFQRNMSDTLLQQSLNLRAINDEFVRRSFIQGTISSVSQLTKNPRYFNAEYASNMVNAVYALINGTYGDSLNNLIYDTSFNTQFFNIFENIYTSLKLLLDKRKITNAMMDEPPSNNETLSNLTKKAKGILGVYERMVSIRIFESQTFQYNNTVFSFFVTKFSRMAKHQSDQKQFYPYGEYTSFDFPLSDATQPTSRQSFAVMNFRISPFIGDWYLNQSATSDTSVYFSYRDENGGYLNSENVLRRIKITYKYEYSPFIFLPNVTTCGYIGLGESQWENKSCQVEFSRYYNNITCHCLHMSYYSIIDDYLVRPQKVPLIYLTFRNWSSFIVILYMILIFVIGTIYTFNKDNQDFRYLHEQEELQGNTLSSENSVNLVSLAFKRKVFFMMFAEKYKFSNLLKLYLMLLHPVFQLKYRLDPEHPRFYRFLLLYSRVMILFAVCFFVLKDVPNFEELLGSDTYGITVFEVIILIMLGSLILVPMPIILLCCCRSRYFLIDPKGRSRDEASDNEMDDDDNTQKNVNKENQRNRISDVMIDTNIPIKLLFLVNAFKIDDILEHYKGSLSYATGDSNQIGKKLFELDYELQQAMKVKDSSTDDNKNKKQKNKQDDKSSQHQKNKSLQQANDEQTVNTQSFLRNNEDQQAAAVKNPQDSRNRTKSMTNTLELNINRDSMRGDVDSNRPLELSPNKSRSRTNLSMNKTDMNMLDGPGTPLDDESFNAAVKGRTQQLGRKNDKNKKSQQQFEVNYNEDEENLDDDNDYTESKKKRQFYEGGEKEKTNNKGKNSSKNNNATGNSDMEFDDITNNSIKGAKNKNKLQQQQQQNNGNNNNNNNEPEDDDNEEENESDLESIDTQLFVDEKKELIEDRDRLLLAFGNSLAFVLNLGLFIAVLASFIAGGYYDKRNQYVWVVVFFGAQLFSFFFTDILVLWLMALSVTKCCRKNKTCLTRWMRESLYVYEDYKYVVTFANTRIT